MPDKIPQGFCVLPWSHIHLTNDGGMYPCCVSSQFNLPNIDNFDKQIRAKNADEIESARNTNYFKKIRLQMLNGEMPEVCRLCYKKESLGGISSRINYNKEFEGNLEALIQNTEPDGTIKINLCSADIRINNTCNLRCRMCFPQNSKLLSMEWEKLSLPNHNYSLFDCYEDDSFWIDFFEKNQKITNLILAGGETLLTKRIIWILEYLVELERAHKIALSFHTNLTHIPENLLKILSRFRKVNIMVSIEGVDEVNSYIRFPSNWNEIEANLKTLNRWARLPFISASFCLTVQAYNVLYLDEFLDYSLKFENFNKPTLSILESPTYLMPQILPEIYKIKSIQKLNNFLLKLNKIPSHWSSREVEEFKCEIGSVISCLESKVVGFENELEQFISITKKQDHFRGQNIVTSLPGLSPLFA